MAEIMRANGKVSVYCKSTFDLVNHLGPIVDVATSKIALP